MKNTVKRLEKLESIVADAKMEGEEDLSLLSDEELHREIARLVYKDGSYNGYVFKPLEEYDSMTFTEQSQYIDEVVEVMKPWLKEKEIELKKEGIL